MYIKTSQNKIEHIFALIIHLFFISEFVHMLKQVLFLQKSMSELTWSHL